jgi:hypothetical protein
VLLDHELNQRGLDSAQISGYSREEHTHLAVAAAVAAGRADAGMGILAAARAFGLDFIPVAREPYDLVLRASMVDDELLAPLWALLQEPDFQAHIESLGAIRAVRPGDGFVDLLARRVNGVRVSSAPMGAGSLQRSSSAEVDVGVDDEVEVVAHRFTVVTALPLKRRPRERLAELLDARVVDIRDPIDRVDLVLTPACSPQLIGALQRKYPGARIIVVELDDWDLDVSVSGPVKRILRAGADAYVLADTMEELARKITPQHHQPSAATPAWPLAGSHRRRRSTS